MVMKALAKRLQNCMKKCLNKSFQKAICALFACCGACVFLHGSLLKPSLLVQTQQDEKKPLISTPASHSNLQMKPFILQQYPHSGRIVAVDVHLLFCFVSIGRAETEGLENLYPMHKTAGRSNSHLNGVFRFRATTSFVFPRTQRVKK